MQEEFGKIHVFEQIMEEGIEIAELRCTIDAVDKIRNYSL